MLLLVYYEIGLWGRGVIRAGEGVIRADQNF